MWHNHLWNTTPFNAETVCSTDLGTDQEREGVKPSPVDDVQMKNNGVVKRFIQASVLRLDRIWAIKYSLFQISYPFFILG